MSTELTTRRNALALRRRTEIVGEVIGAFESETSAVFVATAPAGQHISLYVLAGFIVLVVFLSSVVNVDIVVTGTGMVSPVSGVLYVSPFNTGIVKQVNVRAGDFVKKGQALATLDPTFTQADLVQLQQHLDSDEAVVAREQAQVSRSHYAASTATPYQALQAGIYQKQQAEYQASVANYDGQIHSAEALVAQYQGDVREYTKRLKIASDVENIYQPLLEKGYVSALQLMTATDSRTEMTRLLADARNQVDSNSQTMAALIGQKEAFIQKWYSDLGAQLVLDKNDLDLTRDSLEKAQKLRDLVSLDAPEDAIVVKVGKASTGSVAMGGGQDAVTPGTDPLFTLMPIGAKLFADVWVQSQDIGFVKVGQTVRMKLDAYRFVEYGVALGVVKTISENSFTVDENNVPVPPYFKVHVEITDTHLRHVPENFRLLPGNTLTGDIMVGRRTIMSYVVEGIKRTTSEAMREP